MFIDVIAQTPNRVLTGTGYIADLNLWQRTGTRWDRKPFSGTFPSFDELVRPNIVDRTPKHAIVKLRLTPVIFVIYDATNGEPVRMCTSLTGARIEIAP